MKTTMFFLLVFLSVILFSSNKDSLNLKSIPDFSLQDRKLVPSEFTWKIEDIYPSKAEWEKDKKDLLALNSKFDSVAKDWTASSKKMLDLLDLLNQIRLRSSCLYNFASLQSDMDMANPEFQKMEGEMESFYIDLGGRTSFLNPDILALGEVKFQEYLKQEPGLKPYAFGIEKVLRGKDHVLTADKEKLISLTQLFANSSQRANDILNNVEMPAPEMQLSNGEKITLNYAGYSKYRTSSKPEDRQAVMHTYWKNHVLFENTQAVLLDARIKSHLFDAKTRQFNNCLETALFSDNMDPAVYTTLIQSVRENLKPLHRYLALKQKLLGLEKYRYEDIYASAVQSVQKTYTMKETQDILIECMAPMGSEYIQTLKKAFDDRWIDWLPNRGKESGAYCSCAYGFHPYIKLNFSGDYSSLSTLAHELGHALHYYYANKTQPFANAEPSGFLAEIASTFNESMLMQYLIKNEKNDLFKLFLLDNYLDQVRVTIYRQAQFAEFELAMHQRVESGDSLTPEWLNENYLRIARDYYGHDQKVCEVGDFIANEWSNIPHFYLNYYVFTYSTGMIASMALSDMVLNGGAPEKKQYLDFLSAGSSRYSLDTLKTAGVDMATAKPAQAAFRKIDQIVTEMEKIVKRLENQKKS